MSYESTPFDISTVNMNLIGSDHAYTAYAYYKRDIQMNLNPHEQIMFGLKKLGYYNPNSVDGASNDIVKRSIELSKYVDSDDIKGFYNDLTLEELCYIGW